MEKQPRSTKARVEITDPVLLEKAFKEFREAVRLDVEQKRYPDFREPFPSLPR